MSTPRRSSPPLRSPEQRRGDPAMSATTTAVLRLGTRASALATTQSGLVADLIREHLGREVELVEVSTEGDRSSAPLATASSTSSLTSSNCSRETIGPISLSQSSGSPTLRAFAPATTPSHVGILVTIYELEYR